MWIKAPIRKLGILAIHRQPRLPRVDLASVASTGCGA